MLLPPLTLLKLPALLDRRLNNEAIRFFAFFLGGFDPEDLESEELDLDGEVSGCLPKIFDPGSQKCFLGDCVWPPLPPVISAASIFAGTKEELFLLSFLAIEMGRLAG